MQLPGTEICGGTKRGLETEVPHRYDVALLDAIHGRCLCDTHLRSKRSRLITLFQAATKSRTNFSFASSCA